MFTCLQRRHYNKAPLVWIDMCLHWGNYCFLTISFNFLKLNVPKYSRIWYKKIAQVLREGSFSTCRGKRIGCVIFPTMCSNIPTKNTILPLRCHCNIKPDNTKKMWLTRVQYLKPKWILVNSHWLLSIHSLQMSWWVHFLSTVQRLSTKESTRAWWNCKRSHFASSCNWHRRAQWVNNSINDR